MIVGFRSRCVGCSIERRPSGLRGSLALPFLLRYRTLLVNCHQDKLADDAVTIIRYLHRTTWCRVGSVELATCPVGMLEDCTEVSDADDDVQILCHLDIVELVHLYRDGGMQRLFQYS